METLHAMKAKLLKKIRRRFEWRLIERDGKLAHMIRDRKTEEIHAAGDYFDLRSILILLTVGRNLAYRYRSRYAWRNKAAKLKAG